MSPFKKIVFKLGIAGSLLYLFICLTPYINPVHGYFFSFAGLFFPIGFSLMLGWAIISVIFYRRYAWIFFIVLFAGYTNIKSMFGLHQNPTFVQAKSKDQIRILSWNVNNFLSGQNYDPIKVNEMLDFIKSVNADIICFQDYSSSLTAQADASTEKLKRITGLPYSYFSEADYNYGVIIFSKWPFLQQYSIPFTNVNSTESLQSVTIQTNSQLLRVFNTHLSSMNIHVQTFENTDIQRLKFVKYDEAILLKKDKLSRLAYFDKMHAKEALVVKKSIDSAHIPFIFTADLNAVPTSFVYHQISKGLKDAFLEKGWGFGRTYDSLSTTLRIDVLLTSPNIQTVQYNCPHLHLSDHYPIITDIKQ